jgi:hypothetical protein
MRHLVLGVALIIGSLLSVQTAAALMQREAMRGHQVSADFSPQADSPRFAQLELPRA